MAKRRSRGDGGLYWSESRQRWIAEVTVGYTPAGKRIVKKASGTTKTAAKDKLKEILRDLDDGLPIAPDNYVRDAVNAWLTFGLNGRDKETVTNYRHLAGGHVIPHLECANCESCPPRTWTNGWQRWRPNSAPGPSACCTLSSNGRLPSRRHGTR